MHVLTRPFILERFLVRHPYVHMQLVLDPNVVQIEPRHCNCESVPTTFWLSWISCSFNSGWIITILLVAYSILMIPLLYFTNLYGSFYKYWVDPTTVLSIIFVLHVVVGEAIQGTKTHHELLENGIFSWKLFMHLQVELNCMGIWNHCHCLR